MVSPLQYYVLCKHTKAVPVPKQRIVKGPDLVSSFLLTELGALDSNRLNAGCQLGVSAKTKKKTFILSGSLIAILLIV